MDSTEETSEKQLIKLREKKCEIEQQVSTLCNQIVSMIKQKYSLAAKVRAIEFEINTIQNEQEQNQPIVISDEEDE